ncbi:LysE family transporter [Methylobrevis albus]|uniref:LysE family transporter n=1 Tax=Methylobrevis albus TaxID=2793297 RepID=A0A931I0J2_9HYPH|nr:LysE family transporter [Methylobrevis albus]MBH0237063.1 LysE family transporter [Methylobrevis albus]
MDNPLLFLLAVITLLATPGPTNTLLAAAGAAGGVRRSLRLLPAEAAGYLIAILIVGLVLGPLLARLPWVADALRIVVGLYLLHLALRLWRSFGAGGEARAVVGPAEVFLATLANPKSIVFGLGIVPFGSPSVAAYLAAFTLVVHLVGLGWLVIGAGAGRAARAAGRAALVPRCGAVLIAVLGGGIVAAPLLG